jgi:hypothetical protein
MSVKITLTPPTSFGRRGCPPGSLMRSQSSRYFHSGSFLSVRVGDLRYLARGTRSGYTASWRAELCWALRRRSPGRLGKLFGPSRDRRERCPSRARCLGAAACRQRRTVSQEGRQLVMGSKAGRRLTAKVVTSQAGRRSEGGIEDSRRLGCLPAEGRGLGYQVESRNRGGSAVYLLIM